MTLTDRLLKLNAQRSLLIAKRSDLLKKHKSAEAVDRELVKVTAKVLKFTESGEREMSIRQDVTERRLKDLEWAVDDLTSLASEPECARIIAQSNLQDMEKRLRELRQDASAVTA